MVIWYAVMFRTEAASASQFQVHWRLNLTHDSLIVLQFIPCIRCQVRGAPVRSIPDLAGGARAALTRTVETTRGFSAAVIDRSTLSHLYSRLKKSRRICQTG